ncbi:Crp/Fnr family transcriptional regulator [Pedobacter sp. N36a]|uniref:Crp/Fnr family transcriptional regulator n=1 Tax=Pedobacter sp. N36a TaxID=2767996 RepID=UPI001656AB49|nr:Crp/Fnr family transcriptional regulator [Pedobacter sp. N36a]MBC8986682.1 Crp/Fnr family transcriptional regulator [Pedobacter sp. N36a]
MISNSVFTLLLERLASFYPLSAGLVNALRPFLKEHDGHKGEILLQKGKKGDQVWFICEGHAREIGVDLENGNEMTSWFWFKEDFIFAYPGFFSQQPAESAVELIEECRLIEMDYEDFIILRDTFPEVWPLVESIRHYYDHLRLTHLKDLQSLSAKVKYLKFYHEHKSLFNIARHKDIANFLGIKDDGFNRYNS